MLKFREAAKIKKPFLLPRIKQGGFVLLVLILWIGSETHMPATENPNRRDGEKCIYDVYPGKITITRIMKSTASIAQRDQKGGAGYEGYEIWFLFLPQKTLPVDWVEPVTLGEHRLKLSNDWYPGPQFMEKYQIRTGSEHPCSLKLIRTGTCTPMVFDIENVNLSDHFEGTH